MMHTQKKKIFPDESSLFYLKRKAKFCCLSKFLSMHIFYKIFNNWVS